MHILPRDVGIKQLPNLPQYIRDSSMVVHNDTILLCGGWDNRRKCLQLDHGTWKEHSTLNLKRAQHSAVVTQVATFIFGGCDSEVTYEYLPKDSTKWLMGKTDIPGGFRNGFAIAVKSQQEIWLIGGTWTQKRILSFNVNSHTFQVVPFQLNFGRYGHRCTFIPNTNKIMVTGGYNRYDEFDPGYYLDSSEILDTEEGSVTMASPMNSKRFAHGMGVVTVNGEDRVTVFGGSDGRNNLDSVELYNTQTEKWKTSGFKLSGAKSSGFSF